MHDTESGREYGEKTFVALSGLLSTDSFGRRLGMKNIYNLNNYINIRAQFQERACAGPGEPVYMSKNLVF